MPCIRIPNGILTVSGKYDVGSQPPAGFLEWYEWAETQHKAGLRQVECHACGKWRYPQELSDETREYHATDKNGNRRTIKYNVCNKCTANNPETPNSCEDL
jgi:hypothetical protein